MPEVASGSTRVFRAIKELCDGCRMCELTCSLKKTGNVNPYLARIKVTRNAEGIPAPIICRHCKNAPCYAACPVPGAMTRNAASIVSINDAQCIGCMACAEACPFGAIQVGPNREVLKCDLCGGDPTCVKYCPPRPDHSLPSIPYPKQSCLQYVEPHKVTLHQRMAFVRK